MVDPRIYECLYEETDYNEELNKEQHQWGLDLIFGTNEFTKIQRLGSSVLDLGCGRGALLKALQERGFSCTGVDYAAPLKKLDWGAIRFIHEPIQTVRLERVFDFIICNDVLEHVEEKDIPDVLYNIYRHLSLAGRASLCVANHSDVYYSDTELHVTQQDCMWWMKQIERLFKVLKLRMSRSGKAYMFWVRTNLPVRNA
jgi:2-polyprenyl-3-methyl-5-hydroxy-6-metoxy-1,4-benzoquinol methylase